MRRLSILITAGVLLGCSTVPGGPTSPTTPTGSASLAPAPMRSNGGLVSTRMKLSQQPLSTMAVSPSGDLYVATQRAIVKVAKDGSQAEIAPIAFGASPDQVDFTKTMTSANAIALDKRGILHVATSRTLYRIHPDGRLEHLSGVDFSKYSQPGKGGVVVRGMTFDSRGNLYLAAELSDTIHKVTPDGVESLYAGLDIRNELMPMQGGAGYRNGPREQALFRTPMDIVADAQDNLYVADLGNAAIRKITPDGMVSTFFGREEHAPLPTTDPNSHEPGSIASSNPGAAHGIARDRLGNFYLSGSDNRIHKLSPDGSPTELAGTGHRCVYWHCWSDCATPPPQNCYADGPGSAARFELPRDIGVDDQGVVYVLDGYSDLRIRAIE